MRKSSSRVFALVVAAGVMLSACSSTDRMAAPEAEQVLNSVDGSVPSDEGVFVDEGDGGTTSESDTAPTDADEIDASLGSDGSPDPDRGLFNKSTRVCIRNESASSKGVVDIQFTKADTSDSGWLDPKSERKQRCAEGRSRHGTGGWDVRGTLKFPYFSTYSSGEYLFLAENPDLGRPELRLSQTSPVTTFACSLKEEYSVGEKSTADDGLFQYTIERLPDSDWKEFRLTIRDSIKPSSDGKVRACR